MSKYYSTVRNMAISKLHDRTLCLNISPLHDKIPCRNVTEGMFEQEAQERGGRHEPWRSGDQTSSR